MAGPARPVGLTDVTDVLCRGGWPANIDTGTVAAQQCGRDYLDEVHRADVYYSGGPRRDPAGMRRLLRSLARNTATEAQLKSPPPCGTPPRWSPRPYLPGWLTVHTKAAVSVLGRSTSTPLAITSCVATGDTSRYMAAQTSGS